MVVVVASLGVEGSGSRTYVLGPRVHGLLFGIWGLVFEIMGLRPV